MGPLKFLRDGIRKGIVDPQLKENLEQAIMAVTDRLTSLEDSVKELQSEVKELMSQKEQLTEMREQFAGVQTRDVTKTLGRWTWYGILAPNNLPQFGTGKCIDSTQSPNTYE